MPETHAQVLHNDPRVVEARRLILAAWADRQAQVTGVRPPLRPGALDYGAMIERFGRQRGGPLFYPYLGSGFGRGPLVELADGSIKYDFIGGIGVHYFGHGDPRMIEAALEGALEDTVMQGNLQQTEASARLVDALLTTANQGGASLAHCFLATSGAMANENALKLAFYHRAPADRMLAFRGCFCGRTMALASITDKPAYRAGLPRTVRVDYVPFFDAEHPKRSTDAAVAKLQRYLQRFPDRHAGMIMELVQGESGYYPGDAEYFHRLIDVLEAARVPVIVDEIQTFGRLARPFAFQHYGLDRRVDMVTVGKLTQVCATLFTAAYKPPAGLVSQTFTAGTASIHAALRILDTFSTGDLFGPDGRIERLSGHFRAQLEAMSRRHPNWVRGPYGAGAMVAFTAFDGKPDTARALLRALFDAGVIAFLAGADPARIRFLLPAAVTETSDIDAVCDLLESALATVSAERQGAAA